MKWMLIVLLGGVPVKTNLLFDSLSACLQAEESMAKEYADSFNATLSYRTGLPADQRQRTEEMWRSRMARGACIPHSQWTH